MLHVQTLREIQPASKETLTHRRQDFFHRETTEKCRINWLDEGMEEFEAIYLPLSEDGVNVSHILHAFVCDREKMLLTRQIAKVKAADRCRRQSGMSAES